MNRNIIKIFISALVALAIATCCAAYVDDYYPAATEAFNIPENVDVRKDGDLTICESEGATKGLIFYPGGKVEHKAYLPLALAIADGGVTVVICEMPMRLAVLDVNAADGISEMFPEITDWYIGGHSLGGSMAASYMAKNDYIKGLVLLGSYSTADVSDRPTLSIYGSEDKVMNGEKYEEYKSNLGENLTETVIDGGCHAYFGMYGPQEGDGQPTITAEAQISLTADYIIDFIN